jgi:hypothetical protein
MLIPFKRDLSEYIDEDTMEILGIALEYTPIVKDFLNARKVNRAVRRIEKNCNQITKLNALNGLTKNSIEFYAEKVLPIVLEDFYNEHEDAKIYYLLNGVYNIILEEQKNESVIYSYLETLRNLHYSDIRRLLYCAGIDRDDYFSRPEMNPLLKKTENKLEKEGLLILPISNLIPQHIMYFQTDIGLNDIRVTEYGANFLNFINEK